MIDKFLYSLIFLIFFFAPFDIVLNVKLLGFNFRLVNFLVAIFIVVSSLIVVREFITKRKIYFPIWLIFLIIVGVLNTIFIVNSILLIRGITYAIWLWMFIIMVFLFANLYNKISTEILVKLYIISFVIHSLFGILQQILFYNFEINLLTTQPGRANGFTYEPSYYLTYLSPSLILAIFYALFLKPQNLKSNLFYYISVGIILSAMIFSTSKMVVVIFVMTLAFLILFLVITPLNQTLKNNISGILKGIGYVTIFSVIIISIVYSSTTILPSITKKEVSFIKKMEKIQEEKESTSFGPRMEVMKRTLEVALDNIIIGTSLGGIAPHIAKNFGIEPKSNSDVKDYEGMCIYLEILAGVGIIGFLLFGLAILKLIYDGIILSFKLLNKEKLLEFGIIFGLIAGLIIEMTLLAFNQNVLRFYLWNHIALLGLTIKGFYEENKNIVN